MYLQSHWFMQLIVAWSGSLLLSNDLLFRFKSKNEFILEISKLRQSKKKSFVSRGKWNYFGEKVFYHPTCVQIEFVNGKPLMKCWESSLKNKSRSHFLEEIFWPADSKSLGLRSGACEMQLSCGVWGSPFKPPPTVSAKVASSWLRESM